MSRRLFTHPSRQLVVTRLVYHGKPADVVRFTEMSMPHWHQSSPVYWGDIH